MKGASLDKQQGVAGLDGTDVREVMSVAEILRKTTGISFVSLSLKDNEGKPLSQNVYWMSPGHDFTALRQMPPARVQVAVLKTGKKKTYTTCTLPFTNISKHLAFFLPPTAIKNDHEVLPTSCSTI